MANRMPSEPFSGAWTFCDYLRSVQCAAQDTEARCVTSTPSTTITKETFPATGHHTIVFRVLGVDPAFRLAFGVVPVCADLTKLGDHVLGDPDLGGSVGLVCVHGAGCIARGDGAGAIADVGEVPSQAVVEVEVAGGVLRCRVDGVQCGLGVEGLRGRLRFAVSLCGAGQGVRIEGGRGVPGEEEAEGAALIRRKVLVRDATTLTRALRGTRLLAHQRLPFAHKLGTVQEYDGSDDTYRVSIGNNGVWLTGRCLDVLPLRPPREAEALVGREVQVLPLKDLLTHDAANLLQYAQRVATIQAVDPTSHKFVLRMADSGAEVPAPRDAFHVLIEGGYTLWRLGDGVREAEGDRPGVVIALDVDGPEWVEVRWRDGGSATCRQADLVPHEVPPEAEAAAAPDDDEDHELPAVLAGVRRVLFGHDLTPEVRNGGLLFRKFGALCTGSYQAGVVVFTVHRIAAVDTSRLTEVSALLNATHRKNLMGRYDLDDDGDVNCSVSVFAGDDPLQPEAVARCLRVMELCVDEIRPKLVAFVAHEPCQTFPYLTGVNTQTVEWFDISDEACHRHATFSHGDRVRDPQTGNTATVIGVRKDTQGREQLWYHADCHRGAGLYEDETVQRLQKIGSQVVTPAA